jgi:photosystem II stability/assembly factor-like uncharacterized protein
MAVRPTSSKRMAPSAKRLAFHAEHTRQTEQPAGPTASDRAAQEPESTSAAGTPAHSAEEASSAAPSTTTKGAGLGEKALTWRSIGPFRGGRVVAVAGDPTHPYTFYFGSTGGGVWKTTDGGRYWQNVSDGFFKRASVGALAVSPSDPNVIYAGMGEPTIRGNVSHGDGVYKSTDAGKTWTHLGLAATRHIARICVHPANPDLVYVAALGHAHGPSLERGIYRSRDGGASWEHVLSRSEDVGANELSLDLHNPRILYATFWRARRLPHKLESGGEGCGIWKTTDGGDHWTELTHNKGLPTGTLGKIGITASPARADRVWAVVEAEQAGVYRSDDGGANWELTCHDHALGPRPWYYQHIHADPQDPETVWLLSVRLWRSHDGGRSFQRLAIPHGDNHALWIDPRDSNRLIEGNDGGACVSYNGGDTWSSLMNQPTAEFYHVTTDTQTPYRVYGAQQDNSTLSVPSRSVNGIITEADCIEVGGGESGYIAVRQDDPHIIYAGSYQGYISRYDCRTGQRRDISVWPELMIGWPAKDVRERFQWTFPIHLSPHNPNMLYVGGNHVLRSTDEGASWQIISPDLTRNDPSRMQNSGGMVTLDNCGTEYYGTVFALAESPCQRGLLWAGSDDGLVHVSRDDGQHWDNVTPAALPEWALISIIAPSSHDPAVAYLAANRYKDDDFAPYLFKTDDYGRHWVAITNGLPEDVFTRVIREDPARRGLLYVGTETGVYVSFDDGLNWQPLQFNLPVVPVHDLQVKEDDLIAATHGRAFWVLDDLSVVRQWSDVPHDVAIHLFTPRPTVKFAGGAEFSSAPVKGTNFMHAGVGYVAYLEVAQADGSAQRVLLDGGQNPPDGVTISYLLRAKPEGEATLTFLDAQGREIKRFSSEERKTLRARAGDLKVITGAEVRTRDEPRVAIEAGLNRFTWDMRYPDAGWVDGYITESGILSGPVAAPGRYQARLTVGDQTQTVTFEIAKDSRISASQEDLDAQFALLCQIRDKVSEIHQAVNQLTSIRQQLREWNGRARKLEAPNHEELTRQTTALISQLDATLGELIETHSAEDDDTLRFPVKLNVKLADLMSVVASADAAPTRQAREVFTVLCAQADTQLTRLRALQDGELAAINTLIREASLPAVAVLAQATDTAEEQPPPTSKGVW